MRMILFAVSIDPLNSRNCLYFEHIVQSHRTTCLSVSVHNFKACDAPPKYGCPTKKSDHISPTDHICFKLQRVDDTRSHFVWQYPDNIAPECPPDPPHFNTRRFYMFCTRTDSHNMSRWKEKWHKAGNTKPQILVGATYCSHTIYV